MRLQRLQLPFFDVGQTDIPKLNTVCTSMISKLLVDMLILVNIHSTKSTFQLYAHFRMFVMFNDVIPK